MPESVECKCGHRMTVIAFEKDYGDTSAVVSWCKACGRVHRVDYELHPDLDDRFPATVITWHEPDSVKTGEIRR